MKKLLILMLVLGLTSAANAVVVDSYSLYVNTAPPSATYVEEEWTEGIDSEIYLLPSDNLWIGVHNSVQGDAVVGTQKDIFVLGILQPAEGPADTSWTGTFLDYRPPLVADAPVPANEYAGVQDFWGDGTLIIDMWVLNLTSVSMTLQGVGVLDAKELHCDWGPSEDTIYLVNASTGLIEDTLIIHQIPEPMTIMLLGLGGLLLRRRK